MRLLAKNIAVWASGAARTAICLMLCAALPVTMGCSTIGSIGNALTFWTDGDPEASPQIASSPDPERIAVALDVTRAKMRLHGDEPYWPYHIGELYTAIDSTSAAVTHLRRALEIDAGYAPAAALLSKIYYDAGMYDPAIELLTAFISRNADAPDALRAALALHLEAVGDLDAAHGVLAQCSNESKEVSAARTFVTLRDDDLEAALAVSKQALDNDPKSAANHNNYGISLLWAGQPAEARTAFLRALELDDALPGALYNMAIVEAFYFFNEEAGREWFARYQRLASEDPDDLASRLGAKVTHRTESGSAE